MKNSLVGVIALTFLVGIIVFGFFFAQTQFQAAFHSISLEVYIVKSISRLLWLIFSVAAFMAVAEKFEMN